MAQSLNPPPTPATVTLPISTSTSKKKTTRFPCVTFPSIADDKLERRRILSFGMAGAVLGFNFDGLRTANAAARRPPPSPAEEKKDPNVSGVQAKVLASKKRKEAMKESMAKLREKGKAVD
ncbi:hypothetical protein FNV43_RR07157 [Rhamnella rubrinervis]|uniref:Uncharacterized protein n=1 Tax=Rhamnella rubrinervis TaxID=2594499 RepID=A0A8K0HFA4_9ROSA|nr:hypothetical protein FNV43_RR07157 [Rhamnella rubrinervis]